MATQRKHGLPDIEALVAGFRANAAALREPTTLEASLRQQFLVLDASAVLP